jgi:hypothetical protein
MFTSVRRAAWPLLAATLMHATHAQPASIPMDAAGRALRDDRGAKLEYSSTPEARAAGYGGESSKTAPLSQGKNRAVRFESTGTSPSYQEQWRVLAFGSGIGATGFWPMDTDNDGDLEIILGGGSGFGANAAWSIVSFDSATREFEIVWQSPAYAWPSGISALRAVEAGGAKRVWVGRADGRIDVVNALTRATVATLNPSTAQVNDFGIADADNDGQIDVVAVTETQMFLYDPASFELRRTIANGGQRVAIGNVDADVRNEIVLNTGLVLDVGAAVTVQWSTDPFGARVQLADLDGDGMAELVAAQAWYLIRAWDLDAQSLKWSYNADLDIAALRLVDVAGDSTPEIVYGDGQWGDIVALDAATRSTLWTIPNPEHGVTDIGIFDADGDGAREVLWGAGWTSTGPDYLYVHDLATRAREWQSVDFYGPYEAVDIGDVDGDGRMEIVVVSYESESGYADGLIMIFDAITHALEWRSGSNVFDRNAWTGVHGLRLANVDADPQPEMLVTTDRLYDGALYVIDGVSRARQSATFYDSGSPLGPSEVADLTGDGRPELITGNLVAHTGSPGVFLYVLDPATGARVWTSAALATGFSAVTDVLVADVGEAGVDLLAASGPLHVIRWSDRRHLTTANNGYLSAAAGNVLGSAAREILAARSNGAIDVLDGETLQTLDTHAVCAAPIRALQMQTTTQAAALCEGNLVIYDFAARIVVDLTQTTHSQLGNGGALVRAIVDGRAMLLAGGNDPRDCRSDGRMEQIVARRPVPWSRVNRQQSTVGK